MKYHRHVEDNQSVLSPICLYDRIGIYTRARYSLYTLFQSYATSVYVYGIPIFEHAFGVPGSPSIVGIWCQDVCVARRNNLETTPFLPKPGPVAR